MELNITKTQTVKITSEMTAKSLKSGAVEVLATPIMIAFMENVCMDCVQPYMEQGNTTVGTVVNVAHLGATPVGMELMVQCKLVEIDRRRLVFEVTATDEHELVGKGTHERFIINTDKFEQKCREKHA